MCVFACGLNGGWRSKLSHPLEQARGVRLYFAASLRNRGNAVLAVAFADDFTVHKHRDQVAVRKPSDVGLAGGSGRDRK